MKPEKHVNAKIEMPARYRDLIEAKFAALAEHSPEIKGQEIMMLFASIMSSLGMDSPESVGRFQDILSKMGEGREMWHMATELLTEDILLNYAESSANRTLFFLGMVQASFMLRQGVHEWLEAYRAEGDAERADSLYELDRELMQPFALMMGVEFADAVDETKTQRGAGART